MQTVVSNPAEVSAPLIVAGSIPAAVPAVAPRLTPKERADSLAKASGLSLVWEPNYTDILGMHLTLPRKTPSKKVRAAIIEEAKKNAPSVGSRSTYISVANTSKIMRLALAEAFPGVKFSVRSKSYSGGASASVDWTDGPTVAEVDSVLGYFKGKGAMDQTDYCPDSYEDLAGYHINFGSDYVFTSRAYTRPLLEAIAQFFTAYTGWKSPDIKTQTWEGKDSYYFEQVYNSEFDIDARIRGIISRVKFAPATKEAPPKPERAEATEGATPQGAEAAAPIEPGNGTPYTLEHQRDWSWIRFQEVPKDGETEAIKALGFRWSRKRSAWYATEHVTAEAVGAKLGATYTAPTVETESNDDPNGGAIVPAVVAPPAAPVPSIPAKTPEQLATEARTQHAEILRRKAEGMAEAIERKLNPACGNQRPTARRANMAENIMKEGEQMQRVQSLLYALADQMEAGTLPEVLAGIKTKKGIEALLYWPKHPGISHAHTMAASDTLEANGVNSCNFEEAKTALGFLLAKSEKPANPKEKEIKQLERELIGRKIPGFFYTQPETIQRMINELGEVRAGDTFLEPSAGKGDIADTIKQEFPGSPLLCVELVSELERILTLKEHETYKGDFIEAAAGPLKFARFNHILMNPPFEGGQDAQHVQTAYKLLAERGSLVSVMGAGAAFRQDSTYRGFREWLEGVGGVMEDLPAGSFTKSGTGVNTVLVTIRR